jgi:hypothetical protein
MDVIISQMLYLSSSCVCRLFEYTLFPHRYKLQGFKFLDLADHYLQHISLSSNT